MGKTVTRIRRRADFAARLVVSTLLLWSVSTFGPVHAAGDRVALIVGNDAYEHLPRLTNAANDARALDAKLRKLGFETHLHLNADERALNRAIFDFAGQVAPGGVGLVFYAGHGVESGGRNYLIPVDADLQDERDLRYATIPLDRVMSDLKDARARLNLDTSKYRLILVFGGWGRLARALAVPSVH
jgi:hypothetical protein